MNRKEQIHSAAQDYFRHSFSNSTIEAFKSGAKYADNTLLDKAIAWLIDESNNGTIDLHNHEDFTERFITAMKN